MPNGKRVLDASAAIELLMWRPAGVALAGSIASREVELHAPALLDLEVANAFRRWVLHGWVDEDRAAGALIVLTSMDIHRHDHLLLMSRIWSLRENLTAYDAAYVALAELLEATLLTADARLARASGHQARVELVR